MPDGDVHALGFNEPQGLLKASKLISSVLLVIRICRSEMRENAFDVDARQRRGQLGEFASIAHMHADAVHARIHLNMDFSLGVLA